MTVAGRGTRRPAPNEEPEAEDDTVLDHLLLRQYQAALRLDRTAQVLTFIAWVGLILGTVAGVAYGVIASKVFDNYWFLLMGLGLVVVNFVGFFLPAYFAPT